MAIADIVSYLKKKLQDFGQANPDVIKLEKPIQQLGQTLGNIGNRIQSIDFNTPTQSFIQKQNITNPIAKFAISLPPAIAESTIKAPVNIIQGGYKTGVNLGNMAQGNYVRPQELLGNIGQAAEGALSLGGISAGKKAISNLGNRNLLNTIGESAQSGLKFGGGFGLSQGLQENQNKDLISQLLEAGKQSGTSGLMGGVLGGVTGGIGYGIKGALGKLPTQFKEPKLEGKWIQFRENGKPVTLDGLTRDQATNWKKNLIKKGIKFEEGWNTKLKSTMPINKELDPLLQEAKKYKSAEEFVKNQKKLFRGETNVTRDERTIDGVLSTSENPDIAKIFSGENGKFQEFILDPQAKVIKLEDLTNEIKKIKDLSTITTKDWINYAKKNGYDAIDMKSLKLNIQSRKDPNLKGFEDEIKILNPKVLKTKSQLTDIWNKAQATPPLSPTAKTIGGVEVKQGLLEPKTARVWIKSRFSNNGKYADVPIIRKEENITLYQGGAGENRQFWTKDKKYAEQFGKVKEKTGTFYQVDNGNRVTNVYVEAPNKVDATQGLLEPQIKEAVNKVKVEGGKIKIAEPNYDNLISEAKKEIGRLEEPKITFKQTVDNLYTQWVDRYNPLTKASQTAKNVLKVKGAELRPEYDPEYLVRRLTGAGGIADTRYQTELKPIIEQIDKLKIDKNDLDVFLKAKRDLGFGTVGREIKGSDPKLAQERINALYTKYGTNLDDISSKLYEYQNKGFQEMVDAGFLSKDKANLIRQQNPDYVPFNRVMDEVSDYLGLPTRKTMQGTQPIQKIKGSEKQIESPLESIIGNTFKQRAAIEKNRVAQSVVRLQNIAPELGFEKVAKSGNDTITVFNNGNKEYWKVGQDIADVAKGLNEESMNTLLKIFQAPAALLRQGATGRNPEFMIPNIIRDQLDAGVTSKYGYIPFIDYLSGLRSMLKNDDIYQRWQSSGAKIDLGELSGKKSIQQALSEKTAKKGLFDWIGQGLDIMGKYSEVPTRVGLFKKAYKKTGNELLSAMESRDATVDFARMGSKMKVANSIIPFLNVGVQGFDKLIRSVKDNPGKVLLNGLTYGALPTITTTAWNLMKYPQEYAEIPQYEKDSNFVIVTGRNAKGTVDYITIPKGNVLPVITNPIENFMSYMAGTNQQTFGEFATQFLSSALPVVGDGQSLSEVALKTIGSNIPQAIKPVAENLLNKSFWKYNTKSEQSKEIVPSYLQKREPYLQSYEWTPEMYKKIGAALNVSPLQVQNLMEGYLAGYTKIPSQAIDIMNNISKGNPIEKNETPLLRRFINETYPTSVKNTPQVEQTPFWDRVLPKSEAAETSNKPSDMKIENERYLLKSSSDNSKNLGGGIYLIKGSDGSVTKIDISKPIEAPKTTGNVDLDKQLITKYNSEISTRINKITDIYKAGEITAEEANKKISELKKSKVSSPKKITIKKTPAIKSKKISVKKVPKAKNIKFKTIKLKPIKIKSVKIPKTLSFKKSA